MKKFSRKMTLTAAALALVAFTGLAYAGSGRLPAPATGFLQVFWGWGGDGSQSQPQLPPTHEISDDAIFAKKTKSFSMMPFNKADLEFEIYLPADWTAEDLALGGTGLDATITGTVARFSSPMIITQRAITSVDVLKLEHEISAKNWLKHYLTASGFLLQGDVTEINNKSAVGYYTRAGDAGVSNFGHISARISGSYVVTARFEVPLNLKDYMAFLQKKSIESFKLLYPKEDPVEEQKIFTLVDAIKFNYPASWKILSPDFRDMNRLAVQLQNIKAGTENTKMPIVQGFIRFVAVRRMRSTDLMSEIENMREYFDKTMNIEFKKMISTGKSDAYPRFLFNRYEIYDVVSRAAKAATTQEIHLVVLGDKEWYVFAFLFTPKEANELYAWGRNVQSFREIIKSIK